LARLAVSRQKDNAKRASCEDDMEIDGLFALALESSKASYSPYSHFRVGAAIQCADGSVFTGTNIENRSFGLTTCAERNALAAAVGAGKRDFTLIVVATPDAEYPVSPCGACRQVLSEFMGAGCAIMFGSTSEDLVVTTMGQLFPHDALHELGESKKGNHEGTEI
jgi:cytidine deaminase